MTFLGKTKITDFDALLDECNQYISIDKDRAKSSVMNQIHSITKNTEIDPNNEVVRLEKSWYSSLETSEPNYSVYSDPYYVCDIWTCWSIYSSKSIKSIMNPKSLIDKSVVDYLGSCKKVLDLGCGFGFTTACLKELYPDAEVVGTNLKDSWQYKVSENIAKKQDFVLTEDSSYMKDVDLIFASEYFEHIENSLEHLNEVIENNNPRMLVVANGYNGKAIGHFNQYIYKDKEFTAKETSLNFGKSMRGLGYKKLKTKIWNDRPAIWVREERLI